MLPCIGAFAGSVHLVNDTPYTLRAEVRGAEGSFLGEVVLKPEHSIRWSDSYGQVGSFGKGSAFREYPSRSLTPYQVHWKCLSGADFSICTTVATGATVSARTCDGRKMCNPDETKEPKKQE